jgi:hypothetical protein
MQPFLPLLACMLACLVAGCGGASRPTSQTVQGDGFGFQAPLAWRVSRSSGSTAASSGPVDRVEVLRFRLEKTYRPALFAATARELDGVIARIAAQLHGRVVSSSTVELDGRRARSYRLLYGAGKAQEIAFVLDGEIEYELLCRKRSSEPPVACTELFGSFTLTSG